MMYTCFIGMNMNSCRYTFLHCNCKEQKGLQQAACRCRPISQPARRLKAKRGCLLHTPEQRSQRWAEYFADLFPAKDRISPDMLSHLPPHPAAGQFACPEPTLDEVVTPIKRGREHVSDINTDQEAEHVSKKQVLSCLATFCQSQLACRASRLSCKQSLRNTGDQQAQTLTR